MTMAIGPFIIYRAVDGTLDIGLKCFDKNKTWACGWEYGWEDCKNTEHKPWVSIRVGKLNVLYFQKFKEGFELYILGFWLII